eukprot:scaffold281035_cov26-Tisochrysis_lutea.AAC.2
MDIANLSGVARTSSAMRPGVALISETVSSILACAFFCCSSRAISASSAASSAYAAVTFTTEPPTKRAASPASPGCAAA